MKKRRGEEEDDVRCNQWHIQACGYDKFEIQNLIVMLLILGENFGSEIEVNES